MKDFHFEWPTVGARRSAAWLLCTAFLFGGVDASEGTLNVIAPHGWGDALSTFEDESGNEKEDEKKDDEEKENEKKDDDEKEGEKEKDEKESDEKDKDDEVEDEDEDDEEEVDDEKEGEEEDDGSDEEVLPLTIETLTSIEWKKGDTLPEEVMKYDGKRVKISGYMATGTELDASEFELVPQNCECGRSKVNHFVQVIIEDGGAEFDPSRVQFTGRLEIGEVEEDGFITSLYRLTIETFDPVEPDEDTALGFGAWR